ncbi:polysaccharide deacetylase family protein [Acidobacteriota bacterium]
MKEKEITGTLSIDLEDTTADYHLLYTGSLPKKVSPLLNIWMNRALRALAVNNIKATIFTVGWIAEKNPDLIRLCFDAGHEIASHGYSHDVLTKFTPQDFIDDLRRTAQLIVSITGQRPLGYRAPEFSLVNVLPWGLDVLADEGYLYDSSFFPGSKLRYGAGSIPNYPYIIETNSSSLIEFPVSAVPVRGTPLLLSGGTHLRLLPFFLLRKTLQRLKYGKELPLNVYLHPYEFRNGKISCVDQVPKHSWPSRVNRWTQDLYWNAFQSRMHSKILFLLKSVAWKPFIERCKVDVNQNISTSISDNNVMGK